MNETTHPSPVPATVPRPRGRRLMQAGAGVALALAVTLAVPATGEAAPAGPAPTGVISLADARPGNGAVLTRRGSGSGRFTVDNKGSDSDAVVTLSRSGRASLAIYVRAGATATASRIPDGTYDVYVQRGSAWDSGARRFAQDAAYGEFDKKAEFDTERTSRGIRYSIVTVTLHDTAGGNAQVMPVPENSIPA